MTDTNQSTYWSRLGTLRYLPAFFGLAWRAGAGYTAAMVLLRAARATLPVAMLWVAKAIIDQIVAATRDGASSDALWWYVAIEMAMVIASEVLARVSSLVESLLGDLLNDDVSVRLMEHAAALDLEDFENPAVYDRLERARQQTADRVGPLSQMLTLSQDLVTLVGLGIVVFSYSVWLGLLLVAAVAPVFVSETYFSVLDYWFTFHNTTPLRMLAYMRYVAAADTTAKEVRTLELGPWLAGRHRRLASRLYREHATLLVRKNAVGVGLSLFGVAGYYAAYFLIIRATLRREISIGHLTMLAASFARTRDLVQRLLLAAAETQQRSMRLRDLFAFFAMRPRIHDASGRHAVPSPMRHGIVFEDVSFRYAGSDRWAIRHVSFKLRAGECLALVGENGAGKSTIVKLLARLYEPTEGRILLDGRDLREYDIVALRRAISILFQDFVKYHFRFDENVGIGALDEVGRRLDAIDEMPAEPGQRAAALAPVRVASEHSLAAAIAARLPDGYRQMLGRFFEGGVDLSGGEWQKVALARTYMRVDSAQVLILDEPTAALDARAEAMLFEQFRVLARQRAALLISHRFSTVRTADRIIVLGGGSVIDAGTHDELMARRGLYAELFELQAAGYQ